MKLRVDGDEVRGLVPDDHHVNALGSGVLRALRCEPITLDARGE